VFYCWASPKEDFVEKIKEEQDHEGGKIRIDKMPFDVTITVQWIRKCTFAPYTYRDEIILLGS